MKEWKYKISIFLAVLLGAVGGSIPAVHCTGGCGTCYQCAGLGGITAIFAAIGAARKRRSGGDAQRATSPHSVPG